MSAQKCFSCGADTCYAAFSGGREWHCTECDASGMYDADSAPRRVQLLTTEEGRDQLRAELREELDK